MRLIDLLEEDDDVQTVTHNFDVPRGRRRAAGIISACAEQIRALALAGAFSFLVQAACPPLPLAVPASTRQVPGRFDGRTASAVAHPAACRAPAPPVPRPCAWLATNGSGFMPQPRPANAPSTKAWLEARRCVGRRSPARHSGAANRPCSRSLSEERQGRRAGHGVAAGPVWQPACDKAGACGRKITQPTKGDRVAPLQGTRMRRDCACDLAPAQPVVAHVLIVDHDIKNSSGTAASAGMTRSPSCRR